jgi:hypothetical protein
MLELTINYDLGGQVCDLFVWQFGQIPFSSRSARSNIVYDLDGTCFCDILGRWLFNLFIATSG